MSLVLDGILRFSYATGQLETFNSGNLESTHVSRWDRC